MIKIKTEKQVKCTLSKLIKIFIVKLDCNGSFYFVFDLLRKQLFLIKKIALFTKAMQNLIFYV